MKKLFILLFLSISSLSLSAQWTNTTNQFYDSLHTPVSTALKTQHRPIVVRSYPDSGYIVIWEDHRDDPTGWNENGDIYAQKYDKNGNQLWADNGVPVANDIKNNSQHYYNSSNVDYRIRSYAGTDSAGGFYVTYAVDSTSTYVWERACVQHILNDGTAVFPGIGYIVFTSTTPNLHLAPQLIPDGNKGFFVSFLKSTGYIYIYCFRDENGSLRSYGGNVMNENALQSTESSTSACNDNRLFVQYPGTVVIDYNIWGDLQGGCNIVMLINGNAGGQKQMLTYNKLWRAKKNSTSTQYDRDSDYKPRAIVTDYKKDSVYRLWYLKQYSFTLKCLSLDTWRYVTYEILLQNGYQLIDGSYSAYVGGAYDYNYPKGTILSTPGNINVSFIAALRRTYPKYNTVSNFTVQGYTILEEKYDSIPYQRTSYTDPGFGYNPIAPHLDKLNNFRDTLLAEGNYYYDFSLASGGNQIYSSAIITEPGATVYPIRLQHLAVERQSADSFAVVYKTSTKIGDVIGKNSLNYDFPLIAVNNIGNALFCIRENGGPVRVSPIINGSELVWGAMGRRVGSGVYNGSYHYFSMNQSFVALDPLDGTGLIAWKDNRAIPGGTGENIFMRHLDSINEVNYSPPIKTIKFIPNHYGATSAFAEILLGSSKKYSVIEAVCLNDGIYETTPVVEILDNYNLGSVSVSVFENLGTIRKYNGQPYLDRNYTIKPENNPAGGATINVRLYFTKEEFDALKAADPSISSPADLAVIKQPATGTAAPGSFIFVAGAETIYPQSWAAVPGGYYIEIEISSFSNFFIQKANGTLPLQWLNVSAQWMDNSNAKVSWQVTQQMNVKKYNVQHSYDGIYFENVCEVEAINTENYSCTVPAEKNTVHYYRVLQTDNDGKSSFSKVVTLQSFSNSGIVIYPNPAKDYLYLWNKLNYQELVITNLSGKTILKQNISNGLNRIQILNIPPGIYFIALHGNNKTETLKFVKE